MTDEIQIFISYAREDQSRVELLYQKLVGAGYQPWLDREHLLPGQRWEPVIKQALERSDFVLVCLSAASINKRGFLQKEIKQALERAQEKLEDDVWLIPARLDDCDVPDGLSAIQWVDLFEEHGFDDLLRALAFQLKRMRKSPPLPPQPKPQPPVAPKNAPVIVRHEDADNRQDFEFTTVTLDARGQEVERKKGQARSLTEDLGGGVRIEMVEIAGGEFWMGSTDAEARDAFNDAKRYFKDADQKWYTAETPRHRVAVSPFFMGKYPVTQSEWMEVMGNLPEISDDLRGDDRPVVMVSWEEADAFCRELSRRTKRQYRLPTEAEWEYACRAGTNTPFAFGQSINPEVVNYAGSHPYGSAAKGVYRQKTVPVGSLGVANAFGLYDMHGNVWEWCSDWYGESYYAECLKKGVVTDPRGPDTGSDRVIRGGGWADDAAGCRSANRSYDPPGYRYDALGFRLVRVGP
ncbi:MAG: SUMF1/EgtB/PvdO family nonheme iron enzyme [Blastocatellia bacterium]